MTVTPHEPADASRLGTAAERAFRRAASRTAKPSRPSPRAPTLSGAGFDGRDPKHLADAVEALVKEHGWTAPNAVAQLTTRWPEVVGDDLAAHVLIESFTDGCLLLRAESTAWATQIRLLLPQLRAVIDREVGTGVVADISVIGPQAPSWVAGPRRVAGRGPRDTYG